MTQTWREMDLRCTIEEIIKRVSTPQSLRKRLHTSRCHRKGNQRKKFFDISTVEVLCLGTGTRDPRSHLRPTTTQSRLPGCLSTEVAHKYLEKEGPFVTVRKTCPRLLGLWVALQIVS